MISFKQYFEDGSMEWYSKPIQRKIIAYHGGAYFEEFSLNYLGSGEHNHGSGMNPALGFGIYFSDCKNIAALYTKYSKGKKAIHKVELDTTNIYDLRNGTPHLSKSFENILLELKKTENDVPFRTYGVYEGLFKMMDKYSAIKMLTKHGIDGAFTRLPMGCLEISVINLDIIKKLDKEEV